MDTREKIIDAAHAARVAASGAIVVSGYFDPMVASHAERLSALKKDGSVLLVLIATPETAILPAAARAELVAGLRAVDHVAELVDGLTPQIDLGQEDAERFRALLVHVHARQQCTTHK